MKNWKKYGLVLLLFCGLFLFTACGKKNNGVDPKIVGDWNYFEDDLTTNYLFREDGTGTYDVRVGDEITVQKHIHFQTKNHKILITYDDDEIEFEMNYEVNDKGLLIEQEGEKNQYIPAIE